MCKPVQTVGSSVPRMALESLGRKITSGSGSFAWLRTKWVSEHQSAIRFTGQTARLSPTWEPQPGGTALGWAGFSSAVLGAAGLSAARAAA